GRSCRPASHYSLETPSRHVLGRESYNASPSKHTRHKQCWLRDGDHSSAETPRRCRPRDREETARMIEDVYTVPPRSQLLNRATAHEHPMRRVHRSETERFTSADRQES